MYNIIMTLFFTCLLTIIEINIECKDRISNYYLEQIRKLVRINAIRLLEVIISYANVIQLPVKVLDRKIDKLYDVLSKNIKDIVNKHMIHITRTELFYSIRSKDIRYIPHGTSATIDRVLDKMSYDIIKLIQ